MNTVEPDLDKIAHAVQSWEDRYASLDDSLLIVGPVKYSTSDKVLGGVPAAKSLAKTIMSGSCLHDTSKFPSVYLDTIISSSVVSMNDMRYMPEKTRRRLGRGMALSIALVEWFYYDNSHLVPERG